MPEAPSLDTFTIRTGRLISAESAVLLLEDPVIAENDIPYTVVSVWTRGQDWYEGALAHDAVSAAIIPPAGRAGRQLVLVGASGKFTVMAGGSVNQGTIRENYDFSSAACVEGSAVAVGINGAVFRMIDRETWTDLSLPAVDEVLEALCPFPDGGFLVCGWNGLIAHYDGRAVERCETATNVILTGIACDFSGEITACGQRGVIVRGQKDAMAPLELPGFSDDLWSVAVFQGVTYVASTTALYRLVDDETIQLVKFEGEVIPTSFYHLDVFEDTHLLSVGMKDAVLFNGIEWTRIL